MSQFQFIAVSGFFSSGSSAVVDLIKEYKNAFECDAEIRIIKDPYGIAQLEQSLIDHWDLLNSAASINDFFWLCNICYRNNRHPFSRVGLNYKHKISKKFMLYTHEFINSISSYTYHSDFFYQKFKKSYFQYVVDRIRMGIEYYSHGNLKIANRKGPVSYFAHPSREQFQEAVKCYLEKIFTEKYIEKEGNIILDQAISTNDTDAIHRYFRNCKMIIVDRDPRDMYVEDIVKWIENLDHDVSSAAAGKKYVKKHKALRESIPYNDSDILQISFENLVYNYDVTKEKIEDFLGLKPEDHIKPFCYFNPNNSMKNIGIWKKYYSQYKGALDVLSESLKDFCYGK